MILFSITVVPVYLLTNKYMDCLFSTFLPTLVSFGFFDTGHPNKCEGVFYFDFDLLFPDDSSCEAFFFIYLSAIFVCFLRRCLARFFACFLIHYFVYSLWSGISSVCILDISPLSHIGFANIFSCSIYCFYILLTVFFAETF